MIESALSSTRSLIPRGVFDFFNPAYHFLFAFFGAVVYRFPSKKIKVIAVTGTKGKSSTVEILNAIMEEAGKKTALTNTIRFKIGKESRPNLYKMSMPGRFFIQSFLRQAVDAKCDYAILEMTSQGSLTYRHRFIELDAFVFTNISPEHIEAHGSYENYLKAKLAIVEDGLVKSKKPNRAAIVNGDDKESQHFLDCIYGKEIQQIKYGLADARPYEIKKEGIDFTWKGKKATSPLSGLFNLNNILAAATAAKNQGVSDEIILAAIKKFRDIPGRVEKIEAGGITAVVDYAHTPDSLEKLYQVFRPDPKATRSNRLIAVLGGTGGGRDHWKRPAMGKLAETYCDDVILTDEDPYDEDPDKIVKDVASSIVGMTPTVIMNRRLAIREAIKRAKSGDFVLITGKGTDPYIMGPHDSKTPWSDANVAREELQKH
ncbi:MAG: UDP-N-acetylmuramyl-tripeptide synthetase [Candidatus Pacebacteria bacterium]|nr:UDP-N-acetylmuramyl-tripeptide synthetase [Candidatus Paceibacterota bacterium]